MNKFLRYVWATIFVLVLWWVVSIAVGSPAFPSPIATLPVFADNMQDIFPQFGISLLRLLIAMAIGTLIGAPLGLLLGRSKAADKVFSPVLYILYPIPKIVFLPVLFVFFGLGGTSKIIIIAIAVFFQMLVTMRDAAKAVPETTLCAMRSLGATRIQSFFDVVCPACLPSLFTALRITTGTAVAMLFIAESMAGSTGLGYYIMHSWSMLEYSQMFAGIIAMALMGVLIYEIFDFAQKKLSRDASDVG